MNLDDFQNEVFLRGVTLVNKESKQNITTFHYCHLCLKKCNNAKFSLYSRLMLLGSIHRVFQPVNSILPYPYFNVISKQHSPVNSLPFFQEDLFQTPGLQEELQSIIDCLDTSIPDSIRILAHMSPVIPNPLAQIHY